MNKKLYVIGIDSTPPWMIKTLMDKYNMEGFKMFNYKTLKSTVPPISNPAWVTIYTGLDVKIHKIIDFTTINRDYGRTLLEINESKTPPFWDTLAKEGIKSLIITPVVIFEPSKFPNVDMVTGFPDTVKYSSKELAEKCKEMEYEGEPDILNQLNRERITIEEGCKIYADASRKRAELSKYFIEKYDYDLIFVCFSETDRAIHYTLNLDNWEGYLMQMYKEISDFILYLDKRIKEKNEDAEIMIVSDHGAQPINKIFLSNSWLVNKGYASVKEEIKNKKIVTQEEATTPTLKNKLIDVIAQSKLRRTIYKAMPRGIQKIGESVVESSQDYEAKGQYIKIKETDLDMPNTKVFASVTHSHFIFMWLNDSRFKLPYINQLVNKQELIERLKDDLAKEEFIKMITDGSRYYTSSEGFIAPDLIAELKEGYYGEYQGYAKDKWLVEPSLSGSGGHTEDGLLAIKNYRNNNVKELTITDLSNYVINYFKGG